MPIIPQIILSYHRFFNEENDYRFSRTYEQFAHDIHKKIYDLITIDDGRSCMILACNMLRGENRRAKLFICTSLVGTKGYCTWDEIRELSKFHDIENHSNFHERHNEKDIEWQLANISAAQIMIAEEIGKAPRYFVAPYNQYNADTDKVCKQLGIIALKDRVNILNISK